MTQEQLQLMSSQILGLDNVLTEMIKKDVPDHIIEEARQRKNTLQQIYVGAGGTNWNGNA